MYPGKGNLRCDSCGPSRGHEAQGVSERRRCGVGTRVEYPKDGHRPNGAVPEHGNRRQARRRRRQRYRTRSGPVLVAALAALVPVLAIGLPARPTPTSPGTSTPAAIHRMNATSIPPRPTRSTSSSSAVSPCSSVSRTPRSVPAGHGELEPSGQECLHHHRPGADTLVWMNVFDVEPIPNQWDLSTPASSRSYVWMIRSNRCDKLTFL